MNNPETILEQNVLWRGLTAACVLFAFAWGSVGALADEIKIGVVDTERILAESAPALRALKKI